MAEENGDASLPHVEDTRDADFYRDWAITLLNLALQRLEEEQNAVGRGELFGHLKDHLDGGKNLAGLSEQVGVPGDVAARCNSAPKRLYKTSAFRADAEPTALRFVRFRPPKLERTAEGMTLSLPHIRLDRALEGHSGQRLVVGPAAIPEIRDVAIIGNDVHRNGNPDQNQAGRGITGTFHGDITISSNFVHQNASAGIYLGDSSGTRLDIAILRNVFYNNALRQFGGFTETKGLADGNLLVVDDPQLTAMGAEVGGLGPWEISSNTFWYTTESSDTFRSFIKINNAEQESLLRSDRNLFYSNGPRRWRRADDTILDFSQWQAAGFDSNSSSPR